MVNVVKKRAILGWDNRVRPESVERQSVYNDQRWCFVLVDGKKVIFDADKIQNGRISRQESDQGEIVIIVGDDKT